MGQQLEKPVTDKDSDHGSPWGALHLAWASSAMQGWRPGMEDAHVCLASLQPAQCSSIGVAPWTAGWHGLALFGVMDGHGGEHVAKFCERHLPEELCSLPIDVTGAGRKPEDVGEAMKDAFHRMDDLLRDRKVSLPELRLLANKQAAQARVDPDHIGCTACVCCVLDKHIVVANAGDSRAVLCRGGQAVALSFDHKPNDPSERNRIEKAGGRVVLTEGNQFRVNGNLNLSRALGDLDFKKDRCRRPEEQVISGTPDIHVHDRHKDDEFMVICCDGIWDMMKNQEVVDFVRKRMPKERTADPQRMRNILEALLDKCLSPNLATTGGYGGDNMTAVLVRFQESWPCLDTVHQGQSTTGQVAGTLQVAIYMPTGCELGDILLRVCPVSSSIHVGATEPGGRHFVSNIISLKESLPEGASLRAQPCAKLNSNTSQLVVDLPWHMSPRSGLVARP
mmetsp:Transcript_31716/g.105107  ORF Transcript_31716/g.105107 Transcript_31716/m.105107 type:complete len:450 (-) Transcript_31716:276-1625(-)